MRTITVLIDDLRDLRCDMIIRNGDTAVAIYEGVAEWVQTLLMDNDLGGKIEGWQILEDLNDRALLPPRIELVSSNTAAVNRMGRMLESCGYVTPNQERRTWTKP